MESKNVVISMHSIHGLDMPETERLDFTTDGVYNFDGEKGVLSYQESEVTGLPGTTTTVSVTPEEIIVDRTGGITSRMVFKEGRKESFLYSTPFGEATMGIDTRKIRQDFNAFGGRMEIDYVVNMEHLVAMRNKFFIDVSELGEKQ